MNTPHTHEINRTLRTPWARLSTSATLFTLSAMFAIGASANAGGIDGAKIKRGDVSFSQDGNTLRVRASNGAIIEYNRFSVEAGQIMQFIQPSATSRVLNRVTGSELSRIDGSLLSNGIVYLVNPQGIRIGNGALINVGGFYAAAGAMSDKDFIRGNNNFTNLSGKVVNEGMIHAQSVALVGQYVANRGTIQVDDGVIAMASGDTVFLQHGTGPIMVTVNRSQLGADGSGAGTEAGVSNTGTINAGKGKVAMSSGDFYALALDLSGTIIGKSIAARGGAGNAPGNGGVVAVNGTLDASSSTGKGGTIDVFGERVGLMSGALVNANGTTGGGSVRIGGDYLGTNAANAPQAMATYIDSNARVTASATQSGDGGRVIVWSNEYTGFFGSIDASAVGSGNGGFVETSSHDNLQAFGSVDASSALGQAGTWLLDPSDVTITNSVDAGGSFNSGSPNVFTPTAATATANVATINSSLNLGTSVTINTVSSSNAAGNITLAAAIAKTTGTDATLTLNAVGSITLNADITSTSNALSVALNAGTTVDMNNLININGGNLIVNAGGGVVFAGNVTAGFIDVFGNTNNDSALRSDVGVTVNDNVIIQTTAGDLNITATGGSNLAGNNHGVTINTSGIIQSGGIGKVEVTGTGGSNGNSIGVNNVGGRISSSGRSVTVTGTGGSDTANNNYGVFLSQGFITSGGDGDVTVIGTGGFNLNTAVGNNYGIYNLYGTIQSGGTGKVTVTGNGGNGNSGSNYGIYNNYGNMLSSGSGLVTLTGNGGSGNGGSNFGVYNLGTFLSPPLVFGRITSGGGDVIVTGTGGSGGGRNYGVHNSSYWITSGGTGSVTVTGQGGSGDTGSNYGVYNFSIFPSSNTGFGRITSVGGDVTVAGTGGSGLSGNNDGVYNNSSTITSGGTGNVTVTGQGGMLGSNNDAISMDFIPGRYNSLITAAGNLTLTSLGGAINQTGGTISAAGTTSITAGANDVTLAQVSNNFGGAVTVVSANNVSLADVNAFTFGASTVSGTLAVTAGGAITQNAAITVGGTTSITAGANDVTLAQASNNFGGAVSVVSANNVSLADIDTLTLGASTISGDLAVTAAGAINQTSGAISVVGATTLTASAADTDISLAGGANNFAGAVTIGGTASNVRDFMLRNVNATPGVIANLSNATNLRDFTIIYNNAGYTIPELTMLSLHNVNITTGGGVVIANNVTARTDGAINITGNTARVSNAGVTMNDLVTIQTTNGDLNISGTGGRETFDNNGVVIDGGTIQSGGTGNVTVTGTGGSVGSFNYGVQNSGTITSEGGAVTVTGTTGGSVEGAGNNYGVLNSGTITSMASGNVTVTGTGGHATRGNNIGVFNDGSGSISSIDGNVTVTGTGGSGDRYNFGVVNGVLVSGSPIITSVRGAVTVTGTGGSGDGNDAIYMDGGLIIAPVNLTLTSLLGAINQISGTITVNGATTITASAVDTDIFLAGGANNFAGTVTIGGTASNVRDFMLRNINAAPDDITNLSSATNLRDFTIMYNNAGYDVPTLTMPSLRNVNITTGGAITQTSGTITVGGTTTITAGANNVTLAQATNDFIGAVSIVSARNVSLRDFNTFTFGASTVGGTLAVTAGGAITQNAAITVGGTTSIMAFTNDVTLAESTNSFGGAVSILSALNVSLASGGALTMDGSTVLGNLALTAADGIKQTIFSITVDGATTLTAFAADMDISLADGANNFVGTVTIGGDATLVRDFKLRNINTTPGVITNLSDATNLRDFTIQYDYAGYTVPELTMTSLHNVNITTGAGVVVANNVTAGGTGEINITGNTNVVVADRSKVGVLVNGGVTIQTTNGDLNITGTGGSFSSGSNVGVTNDGIIQSSGAGNVTVTGTGGSNTGLNGLNYGLYLEGTIASVGGNVTVTGQGGSGGSGNDAIVMDAGAITALGNLALNSLGGVINQYAGTITVGGSTFITAGANDVTLARPTNNFGGAVSVVSANNVSLVDANTLTLGASNISGTLDVTAAVAINQTSGAITVDGATTLTASAAGMDMSLADGENNFTGTVTIGGDPLLVRDFKLRNINSTPGVTTNLSNLNNLRDFTIMYDNAGYSVPWLTMPSLRNVNITAGAGVIVPGNVITSGTGEINITGNTNSAVRSQFGVYVYDYVTIQTTDGALNITGTGGADAVGSNWGIYTNAGDIIRSIGSGNVTVTGTGGTSGIGNYGVLHSTGATITSGGGNVLVKGTGGSIYSSGIYNYGIITSSGIGSVTVEGVAGNVGDTNSNYGVVNAASGAGGGVISSSGGTVTVVGTGAAGSDAINLFDTSSIIALGALTLTSNGGAINQVGGTITVDGTTTITAGANIVTLAQATNNFVGAVSVVSANNVSLTDINTLTLGASNISGNLEVTAAVEINQTSDAITVADATTLTASAAGMDISLAGGANDFAGAVIIGGDASFVRDFKLRNTNTGPSLVTNLNSASNLRDFTIIYNNAGFTVPALSSASLRNVNIDAAGITLSLNTPLTTHAGGTVTLNSTAILSIADGADITSDGAVNLTATSGITTAGNVTTTGDVVNYNSATTLTGDILVSTGAGADINFVGTLNGNQSLGLTAGTGNIEFAGAVGGVTPLGAITITSANDVTAAAITASSFTQVNGTGTTTFNGLLNLTGAFDFTGNALSLNNVGRNLVGTGGSGMDVKNRGLFTIANGVTLEVSRAFTQDGDGLNSIGGTIESINDGISFKSGVTLTDNVIMISAGDIGDNITFNSTVNGTSSGAQTLGLTTGNGNIEFAGAVGAAMPLGAITVTLANDVTAAAITASSFTQDAGTGTTTFNGITTTTAGALNVTTNNVTFNDAAVTYSDMLIDVSGLLTMNMQNSTQDESVIGGAFAQTGAGNVFLQGGGASDSEVLILGLNSFASVFNATFTGAVTIDGSVGIGAGSGSTNVHFLNTVDSAAGASGNLALDNSNIVFDRNVGAIRPLGTFDMNIAQGESLLVSGTLTAQTVVAGPIPNLLQTPLQTTSTFEGLVTTGNFGGAALTDLNIGTNTVTLNGGITTLNGGDVFVAGHTITFANGTTIASDGSIEIMGDIQGLNNTLNLGADMTTTGGEINLQISHTALSGDVSINSAGGDITFGGTLNGTPIGGNPGLQSLELTAGTGDILFSGNVRGAFNGLLGTVSVLSARDVTFNGTANATSFIQNTGTGTTTFNGAVTLTKPNVGPGGNFYFNGNDLVMNGVSVVGNNFEVVSRSGVVIAADVTTQGTGEINITGNTLGLSQTGVTVNGAVTIQTTNGNLNITGTGGSNVDGYNYGVYNNAGTIQSGGAGNVSVTGTGGDSDGDRNYGVLNDNNALITSGGGTVLVTGRGGNGASEFNHGVRNYNDSIITSGGAGSVTVTGTGGSNAAGGVNQGVDNFGTIQSGGVGGVTVTGTGGSGVGGVNVGVYNFDTITSGAGGNVTVTGTGGSGDVGQNYGVYNDGTITSGVGGNVEVTGIGGTGDDGDNYGVYNSGSSSTITSGGSGLVTVTGTGGSGGYNYGVYNFGTITSGGSGLVTVTGTGGSGGYNYGVYNFGTITSGNTGRVIVMGTGGTGGDYNIGVINVGTIESGDTGSVTVTGTGGSGNEGGNFGVNNDSGTITSGGMGSVTVTGIGGSASGVLGGQNYGVFNLGSSGTITSGGGDVFVTGTGGTGGDESNYGVWNLYATITASGTGSVTVVGTGAAGWEAIYLSDTSSITAPGALTLTSNGGAINQVGGTITVVGATTLKASVMDTDIHLAGGPNDFAGTMTIDNTAGAALNVRDFKLSNDSTTAGAITNLSDATNLRDFTIMYDKAGYTVPLLTMPSLHNVTITTGAGVVVANNVTAGTDGEINITGNTNSALRNQWGVTVSSNVIIQTTGGDLNITGTGGSNAGGSNFGVYNVGGTIRSGGVGNVTVEGTGGSGSGNNYGVYNGDGIIRSGGSGNVFVTGTGGSGGNQNLGVHNDGTVSSLGSGDVTVAGTGAAGSDAIYLFDNSFITAPGALTLTSNGGAINQVGGTITVVGATTLKASVMDTDIHLAGGPNDFAGTMTIDNTAGAALNVRDFKLRNINATPGLVANLSSATNLRDFTIQYDYAGYIVPLLTMPSLRNVNITTGAGVVVAGNVITSGTGEINITGNTNSAVRSQYGVNLRESVTIQTTDGDLNITGTGGSANSINWGIYTNAGDIIRSIGSGNVTVTGTGGTSGIGNYGVLHSTGATITSNSGFVLVKGTGGSNGSAFGINNYGTITSSGTGSVTVEGVAGNVGDTNSNYGVVNAASGAGGGVISSSGGTVTVVGTGAAGSDAINLFDTSSITSLGALTLTSNGGAINQVGGTIRVDGTTTITAGANNVTLAQSTNDFGSAVSVVSANNVSLADANALTLGASTVANNFTATAAGGVVVAGDITAGGTGAINITGNTNVTLALRSDVGVTVNGGVTIQSTNGNLIITGTGGEDVGGKNYGVYNAGTITSSGSGNVTVTGNGGNGADGENYGVLNEGVDSANKALITSGGGNVVVTGTGGTSTNATSLGVSNDGIYIINGEIKSGLDGSVTVTGIGGESVAGRNHGIRNKGTITSGGMGEVIVRGTGGTSTGDVVGVPNSNYGIINKDGAIITSGGGAVTVIGVGGNGADGMNYGIQNMTLATITSGGTGSVTVTGTGGSGSGGLGKENYGVYNFGSSITSGGNLTITGNGGNGDGGYNNGVYSINDGLANGAITAGGNVVITGTGGDGAAGFNAGVYTRHTEFMSSGSMAINGEGGTGGFNVAIVLVDGPIHVGGNFSATTSVNAGSSNSKILIETPITTTNGGAVDINARAGALSIEDTGVINSDGVVTLTADGGISTAGDVNTSGAVVNYNSATTLTGDILVSTGAGADINFASTLNGTFNLGLTAGTSDITFGDAVGSGPGTALGAITITSARNVTAVAITASSFTQDLGTGTTTFNGAQNYNTAAGLNVVTDGIIALNSSVTTTSNGIVTLDSAATLLIADGADISAAGAVNLTADGGITTSGGVTTTGAVVNYNSATTLLDGIRLDTTGAGTSAGASITFVSTVDGVAGSPRVLRLTAGTGDITFTDAVGSFASLGAITVVSANNVTAAAITASSFTDTSGTGNATFNGAQNYNTAAGLNVVTGGIITLNSSVTTTSNGIVTLNGVSGVVVAGNITAGGTGAINITGNTNVTPALRSTVGVTVNNGVTIQSTNGNLIITGTGGEDIGGNNYGVYNAGTITSSGSGNVTVTGNGGSGGSNNYAIFLDGFTSIIRAPVNLTLTSLGGAINQEGGTITVVGTTTITAGANDVTLAQSTNDFGGAVIVVSANNVSLADANALTLGASTISGDLAVTAAGAINQTSDAILVGGATTLTASAANTDISLASGENNFAGTVTIGGDASFVRDFMLRNVNAAPGVVVNLTNATNLRDFTIMYDNAGYTVPELTMPSLHNVTITTGGGVVIAGNVTAGTDGEINITGNTNVDSTLRSRVGVTMDVNKTIQTTNGDLNITGTGGSALSGANFGVYNAVGTIKSSGGDVTVVGIGGTSDGGSNYGVNSAGTITSVGGAVTVTGTGGTGGSDNDAILMGLDSVVDAPGDLTLISNRGAINQTSGTITVVGATTITAGTGPTFFDVTLAQSTNDFGGAVSVVSANNVSLADANALTLGASTVANNFTATASGGIVVAGDITAGGIGEINITGNTNSAVRSRYGVIVYDNVTIQTTDGALNITGTGGADAVGLNWGIYTNAGDIIHSIGSGNVTVTGMGGTIGSNNYGVFHSTGATITSGGGNVLVKGTGGSNSESFGINNYGTITSSGTGSVTVEGVAGNINPNISYGVVNAASVVGGGVISSSGGTVTVVGTGAAGWDAIYLVNNSSITSLGALTLTSNGGAINQVGGTITVVGATTITAGTSPTFFDATLAQSTNDFGGAVSVVSANNVSLADANALTLGASTVANNFTATAAGGVVVAGDITAGGIGEINITGNTNANISLRSKFGVTVNDNVTIQTTNGNLNITGTGGSALSGANFGVYNAVGTIKSSGGDVTVVGIGGTSDGGSNYGVNSAGTITSGSGAVTVTGTGGSGGAYNIGIINYATISSDGGNVLVTGVAGSVGYQNSGVFNYGGIITSGGTGSVTVIGTGGSGERGLNGGVVNYEGTITSGGGDVAVTGIGGTGVGGSNYGVFNYGVTNNEGTITSVGGAVTVTGTGGTGGSDNDAIFMGLDSLVDAPGDLTLISNGGAINQAGGTITVDGTTTISVNAADTDISLAGGPNNFAGPVNMGGNLDYVRDFKLRDINSSAGGGNPDVSTFINLRDLTIAYDDSSYVLPSLTMPSLRNVSISAINVSMILNRSLTTHDGGTVTFNATNELNIADGANIFAQGEVNLTGTNGIFINGNITTTGDRVSFHSATELTDSTLFTIDTTSGNPNGADIFFSDAITVPTNNAESLVLNAGLLGQITLTGDVGEPTRMLSNLTLTAANTNVIGNIYVAGNTTAGDITVINDTIIDSNGSLTVGSINGGGYAVTIATVDLVLTAPITDVTTFTIQNSDPNGAITLMGLGGLSIDQTDWNFISAGTEVILGGTNYTGTVTVDGAWINDKAVTIAFQPGSTGHFTVDAPITGSGSLTINGSGNTTTLTADIILGSIHITDAVEVNASLVTLEATAGDIMIDGAITSSNRNNLTLIASENVQLLGNIGTSVANTQLGTLTVDSGINLGNTITFGPLATSVYADNVNLNNGASSVLATPATMGTIVSSGNIEYFTNTFAMGQNHKLTSLGGIRISGLAGSTSNATSVALGDVNAVGNLRVNANSITLLGRDGGPIVTNTGGTVDDARLDYVVGGRAYFSVAPIMGGTNPGNRAMFSNPTGNVDALGTLSAYAVTTYPSAITSGLLTGVGGQVLDLSATSGSILFYSNPATIIPQMMSSLPPIGLLGDGETLDDDEEKDAQQSADKSDDDQTPATTQAENAVEDAPNNTHATAVPVASR